MNSLSGWVVLDKPTGITSARLLNRLKKHLPKKTKIGHAGTLDQLASGILPVAIGEATKLIQYAQLGENKHPQMMLKVRQLQQVKKDQQKKR